MATHRKNVKKLSMFYRVLSAFILLVAMISAAGIIWAIINEPFHPVAVLGVLVILVLGHISGTVVFTGYAPKYLLFSHGPDDR